MSVDRSGRIAPAAFGVPHSALYPYLRQRVSTPHGHGELVQVFEDTPKTGGSVVRFEADGKARCEAFRWQDVWPVVEGQG